MGAPGAIVIGNLWPSDHDWHPGIAIYDEQGSERVCLMLGDAGPVLSHAEFGDTLLEMGITDRSDAGGPSGAYVIGLGLPAVASRPRTNVVSQRPRLGRFRGRCHRLREN